jgi:hypothetical protein
MTTYGVSRLQVGEAVSWLVIATLGEYPTEAEAQSVADRLNGAEEAEHEDHRRPSGVEPN